VLTVATGVCCVAFLAPAQAALPGKNGRIAFSVERYTFGPDSTSDFWVTTLRPDGGHARRLEINSGGAVAFSPRGGRLAYHFGGFNTGLHIRNLAGRQRDRQITFPPGIEYDDRAPAWSPDGRQIAFARTLYDVEGDDRESVWIHEGSGERRLIAGGSPSWSVNGDIAFSRPGGFLYTIRPDGSQLRRIVRARCSDPDWSPDGRQIVCRIGSDIATVRADGSQFRRLTRGRDVDVAPVFSPDGRRIVFLRNGSSIMTMSPTGKDAKRVARPASHNPDFGVFVYAPAWQPR
jgi:Tol biopolymer transport system component